MSNSAIDAWNGGGKRPSLSRMRKNKEGSQITLSIINDLNSHYYQNGYTNLWQVCTEAREVLEEASPKLDVIPIDTSVGRRIFILKVKGDLRDPFTIVANSDRSRPLTLITEETINGLTQEQIYHISSYLTTYTQITHPAVFVDDYKSLTIQWSKFEAIFNIETCTFEINWNQPKSRTPLYCAQWASDLVSMSSGLAPLHLIVASLLEENHQKQAVS